MPSILEYAETEFSLLAEKPFTDVDSLLLSQFSYMNLSAFEDELKCENKIEIRELLKAERFEKLMFHVRDTKSNMRLLYAMASSPRWRNIKIGNFVEKLCDQSEEQFAAITVYLDDDHACAVFRGTDATLVGWKEDFNMSFIRPIPSQLEAAEYVNETIKYSRRKIRLGGHSKGGNLAIYAAVKAKPSLKRRIIAVYNNDGPGFDREMIESEEYRQMLPKIKTIVPEHSVVGMLLEHEEKYMIVKSSQTGIMQHDAMSWQVCGNRFETVKSVDRTSRMLNEALSNWINGLSRTQRSEFVETLFAIITSSGAVNLSDLSADRFNFAGSALKMYSSLDRETKIMLRRMLKSLTGEFDKARKMINNKFK